MSKKPSVCRSKETIIVYAENGSGVRRRLEVCSGCGRTRIDDSGDSGKLWWASKTEAAGIGPDGKYVLLKNRPQVTYWTEPAGGTQITE
jgi:hypothetical protein